MAWIKLTNDGVAKEKGDDLWVDSDNIAVIRPQWDGSSLKLKMGGFLAVQEPPGKVIELIHAATGGPED